MFTDFVDLVTNPQFIVMVFTGVAAFATVLTLAMPALSRDRINSRMKVMATERDKMRAERLAELNSAQRTSLRGKPKTFMQTVVERLNLRQAFDSEDMRDKLKMAGLRGQAPVAGFMFFKLVTPPITFIMALVYLFTMDSHGLPPLFRFGIALTAGYVGFHLPGIFIKNLIQKRQDKLSNAFPDALDLLLICVQSGMSIEAAFGKVANEVGEQSIELAEEMSLTTAELSYLPERRLAYENLGKRAGTPNIKAVTTALGQAERYGTSIATALRVMAKESREMRMAAAEAKAAALPPKLTVPMILFFLPVLFVVILGPAGIQFQATKF